MKALLQKLFSELQSAGMATKVVVGAALLAIVGFVGYAGVRSQDPHFRLLYSGLDASHAAAVQNALAQGNVRYQVSQPPAPFVVHVEDNAFYQAQNLVAISGALETVPAGIQTGNGGASSVFLSAPERAQTVLKREWQELEKQLAELDFVVRAHVSTSTPDPSPLRKSAPMTVAVTLQVRGGEELSKAQANTVAKLVRYRFNVPSANVMISDQSGRSLFEGTPDSTLAAAATEALEHAAQYDSELARKTNQVLDRIFGEGMAYVVVNSEWNYQETERVAETLDPKNRAFVSETTTSSSTPVGAASGVGGPVGADAAAEFGSSNAAVPGSTPVVAANDTRAETNEETKKTAVVGRSTEHTRSSAPTLTHLSVSLFLDESLAARKDMLEASVKTSTGFVVSDTRKDTFSSLVTPFASIARDETGKLVPPPAKEPVSEPNAIVETLLERGVELLAAVAFLFVLMKSLKGLPKKTDAKTGASGGDTAGDAAYIEKLAQIEIQELVKSEPEKVSAILSRWAAEDRELAKAGR
jgi:flagellar biosynthesis/type III secretory pathway M-ring protein FliF/YscJ